MSPEVKLPKHYPTQARITESDAIYLNGLPDGSLDMASIWDFGVGVFGSK